MTIPLAILGVGKIARDQHLPTIAASDRFRLAGAVSLGPVDLDVPSFGTLRELLATVPAIRAVSICTPPFGRLALVDEALSLGLDVLLEKPPAATLTEANALAPAAKAAGRTLFLAWHSREAAGVAPASAWLAGRTVTRVRIDWKEDVRVWHPGQEWIWSPGVGVFDPGINALSILTRLLPGTVTMQASELGFPENKEAPITASLALAGDRGEAIEADFSFDQRGPQTWTMMVETGDGTLVLRDGGAHLAINGEEVTVDGRSEYARLYDRFADLIEAGATDADLAPFRLVVDAFLLGRRRVLAPFSWEG